MTAAPHPASPAHSAAILAALPLRPRPGLYLEPAQGRPGDLVVMERTEDPEEGDAIIGLAVRGEDGWYLGCIGCRGEVEEADSGMCQPCRQDAAWQDEQDRASHEQEDR